MSCMSWRESAVTNTIASRSPEMTDVIDARQGSGSAVCRQNFVSFSTFIVWYDLSSADSGHHTAESEHSDTESEVRTLKCTRTK